MIFKQSNLFYYYFVKLTKRLITNTAIFSYMFSQKYIRYSELNKIFLVYHIYIVYLKNFFFCSFLNLFYF